MQDKYVIEIQLEPETAFELKSLERPPGIGSATSIGKFIDRYTGEYWLGKSSTLNNYELSQYEACKEKLANDLYGYYGVYVPRLRICDQPLAIQDSETLRYYQASLGRTHDCHVMSRWLDRFEIYNYLPTFQGGKNNTLQVEVENQSRTLLECGLGHILAVAHWLNDVDVMSPSGKNVGYQLKLDAEGKLYAKSCKIDPGYAFFEFEQSITAKVTDMIQLSLHNHHVLFQDLPSITQQEYLLTLKKIVATSDEQITAFFAHLSTKAALENTKTKQMEHFVSIATLVERLKQRRDSLASLHEAGLQTVQEMVLPSAPKEILPILQRLYCQAKLQYETDVKDKIAFYVPLDITTSPYSELRVPMQEMWTTFLSIPPASSLTTTTTTTITTTRTTTVAATVTTGTTGLNLKMNRSTLLLLGTSGGGKSLATQLLVNDLWQAFLKNPQNPIPLRVELKQFSERTVGQCIINTLLDDYHYSPAQLHELQRYRFVFILDGYDEMANQAKVNLLAKHQATEAQYGNWQAQFIITCRDSYFQGLDQTLFHPSQGATGLQIRYISQLTPAHQKDYLMRYREANPQKKLPDYAALLKENPTLYELLGNPFLLRIFRDALPRWQIDHPHQSLSQLTRYALYTTFMDDWFASEAVRLSMIQGKWLPDNLPERFLDFSLRLAFEMHVQKVDEVNAQVADQKVWEPFFRDQDKNISEVRVGCPLRCIGQSHYSFVHKSFLEYFVACGLWKALEQNKITIWNYRLLPQTPEILKFLIEKYQEQEPVSSILQDRLWEWVNISRTSSQQTIAAANAITLLNHIGFIFNGKYGDLTDVKISGADLSSAILDHVCLKNAELQGVNLTQVFLKKSSLENTNLNEVFFGELPNYTFQKNIGYITYNPSSNKMLAVAVDNNIELWSEDGRMYQNLIGHTREITCITFSFNGQYLASGSWDSKIFIWSMSDYKIVATLKGTRERVTAIAFDPQNNYVVSGSMDKTIQVWSLKNGNVTIINLIGHVLAKI